MTKTDHLKRLAQHMNETAIAAGYKPSVKIGIIDLGEMDMATETVTLFEDTSPLQREPELLIGPTCTV